MKKIIFVVSCCFLSLSVSPAFAQFGGLVGGLLNMGSGGGGIDGQVKGFIDKSNEINGLVFTSLMAINAAYATDADAQKIAEEVKAFNAMTDPKEKAAKVAEAQKTESAKLEELTKSNDAVEKTKKLSKDKQTQVANSVGNFSIAALRALELTNSGRSIVQSVSSNPLNIAKVGPVTDALPILANAISTSTQVLPGFIKILQGANVAAPKVTAESKPQEVKF
jgi:hypothetical protein